MRRKYKSRKIKPILRKIRKEFIAYMDKKEQDKSLRDAIYNFLETYWEELENRKKLVITYTIDLNDLKGE